MVQAFTHGPVKLEAHKDGKFELFGGNVCGIFVELVRKGSELCGMRPKIQ
jgi:activator of HSP90 ATPase